MKVIISDYKEAMMPNHEIEIQLLKKGLDDVEVIVYEYTDEKKDEFISLLKDADALLTGFIKVDKKMMDQAPNLKIISINATGYDNVDLEYASKKRIGVSPVGEYCTKDVAEFTMSFIFSLVKNLKFHTYNVAVNKEWEYSAVEPNKRLEDMTLGIIGYGKIGKEVAKKAKALGMRVLAHDHKPILDNRVVTGVEIVDKEMIFEKCDIITNHMNLNETNYDYFNLPVFEQMVKKPYFLNMGRGACVVEEDLFKALDRGLIKGAAVDVLLEENPNLEEYDNFMNRDNVIVTPHVAFYTTSSLEDLQRISTQNIVNHLNKEYEKVFKLVNAEQFI